MPAYTATTTTPLPRPRGRPAGAQPRREGPNIGCPTCGGPTGVVDSRGAAHNAVRRRRSCVACGLRFTTYERIAGDIDDRAELLLQVAKLTQLLHKLLASAGERPDVV